VRILINTVVDKDSGVLRRHQMKRIIIAAFLLLTLMYVNTAYAETDNTIRTDSTSNSTVTTSGKNETTVNSPPPSAISPSINATNSDLCTVGVSGAVQTQILGVSTGQTYTDENCERLKNAKTLYDMGMKVAAVSMMCQDERVWDAMMKAGTPCPYDGKIGDEAKKLWSKNVDSQPKNTVKETDREIKEKTLWQTLSGILLLVLLL